MLYAQIAQSTGRTREASLGFDVKVLQGHIKEARGIPENSLTQLDQVVIALNSSNLVGTIESPKGYIGGVLPMTWGMYGFDEDSPITFWGFCEERKYPFSGAVMALAGSSYHLLGQQRDGNTHSHSRTEMMTRWFLDNLGEPFDLPDADHRDKFDVDKRPLSESDVANGAWLAATQARGTTAMYEFVAKVLHRSEWPEGFRLQTRRIILASPLYVAMAE